MLISLAGNPPSYLSGTGHSDAIFFFSAKLTDLNWGELASFALKPDSHNQAPPPDNEQGGRSKSSVSSRKLTGGWCKLAATLDESSRGRRAAAHYAQQTTRSTLSHNPTAGRCPAPCRGRARHRLSLETSKNSDC